MKGQRLNDRERTLWVENDESLYRWWRSTNKGAGTMMKITRLNDERIEYRVATEFGDAYTVKSAGSDDGALDCYDAWECNCPATGLCCHIRVISAYCEHEKN